MKRRSAVVYEVPKGRSNAQKDLEKDLEKAPLSGIRQKQFTITPPRPLPEEPDSRLFGVEIRCVSPSSRLDFDKLLLSLSDLSLDLT
jgi:hypothetical protein